MRLTPTQVDTIRDTARRCFGQDANAWLFGSRVDDTRRGGDIDLCIETNLDTPEVSWDAECRFLGALYMALGEQKIDVVVKRRGDQRQLPIFEVARTGSSPVTLTPIELRLRAQFEQCARLAGGCWQGCCRQRSAERRPGGRAEPHGARRSLFGRSRWHPAGVAEYSGSPVRTRF